MLLGTTGKHTSLQKNRPFRETKIDNGNYLNSSKKLKKKHRYLMNRYK